MRRTAIERAFELVEEGKLKTLADIEAQIRTENRTVSVIQDPWVVAQLHARLRRATARA